MDRASERPPHHQDQRHRSGPQPARDALLSLQRQAGNAAAAAFVQLVGRPGSSTNVPLFTVQRLSANVWWDKTPPPAGPRIEGSKTERGAGTAGGAHSTAFALFEWAVVHAVDGKNFADALNALLALLAGAKSMPGYLIADAPTKGKLDADYAAITSKPDITGAAALHPVYHTQVLQDLMVDVMRFRNLIPYTYIAGKSGAKGIGEVNEREGIAAMRAAWPGLRSGGPDPGGQRTKAFASGMRMTFDIDALQNWDMFAQIRWANVLGQHIRSVFQAFPGIPAPKQGAIQGRFADAVFKETALSPKRQKAVMENLPTSSGVS
ncbi:hypothetical protein [Agromyces larvae]|uniref:Phage portal protein n=1 Tax=Agromyces larvae TaxID=2929802 RepID=A0ABY4BVX6_9MICO|nr:hypothetical protein [Agromyces larvae]UOE43371.1 hypothetical protein MTO99_14425 [Agromyces larvae]